MYWDAHSSYWRARERDATRPRRVCAKKLTRDDYLHRVAQDVESEEEEDDHGTCEMLAVVRCPNLVAIARRVVRITSPFAIARALDAREAFDTKNRH